jgi:hypothetical protein
MKLKLKEDPREWQKFTGVIGILLIVVAFGLHRRHVVPVTLVYGAIGIAILLIAASLVWPRVFRPLYRGGMTASFHVGQAMSRVLLTVIFFIVVTPLGILLRLSGKDLLNLRWRAPGVTSHWREARNAKNFEDQF